MFCHNKRTHAYHIWNNIINCFADKIEVQTELNMVNACEIIIIEKKNCHDDSIDII